MVDEMNNLQLGKMYLVKELFWLLYPTKGLAGGAAGGFGGHGWRLKKLTTAYETAKWESESFNCNVDVVEENTCFVLLEVDNGYFKLLNSNGNIGWTWGRDFFEHFELVKE
jgi:hypothetical protein